MRWSGNRLSGLREYGTEKRRQKIDYEMPVINGKMLLRAIRANRQFAGLPVIFLSAVADREYIQELLELKPEGYVLKPARQECIMEMIEKYVG